MEVLYPACCGLDVHQKTVVACAITPEGKETRTFKTMTGDLLQLADWILAKEVTHVAMESTGVYWRPEGQPCWHGPRNDCTTEALSRTTGLWNKL